jgi:hypothetical protein
LTQRQSYKQARGWIIDSKTESRDINIEVNICRYKKETERQTDKLTDRQKG